MRDFIRRHEKEVIGVLSGFDRVRLRGTLRFLATVRGMERYLWQAQVLLKDFREYAMGITDRVRAATTALAGASGRPVVYLRSSAARKEDVAREIARRDGVEQGLICVLTCVEPCWSYQVRRDAERKRLQLVGSYMKCLHHYFYVIDPVRGFLHVRLQTWFPFTVHVCINGREWLVRQLQRAGIAHQRRGNCVVEVADVAAAQALLDAQLDGNWAHWLQDLLGRVHPTHSESFGGAFPIAYYWSVEESEWATDLLFRSQQSLRALYPQLLDHGMHSFGSREVLRFLGHKTPAHGGVNGNFTGEVLTDLRERAEGIRLKHRLNRNSIKMYDKQGTVLRVETTVNDARDLKVYRTAESQPHSPKRWRKLRKGVADLKRRAKLCHDANERYLAALADMHQQTALADLTRSLCRPVRWKGQRVRALNPLAAPDAQLLAAVNRGEFTLRGFRNRDLCACLLPQATAAHERKRQSARMTRLLRLLRAHHLISKVPRTHRYLLTDRGRTAITAILTARRASTAQLAKLAA